MEEDTVQQVFLIILTFCKQSQESHQSTLVRKNRISHSKIVTKLEKDILVLWRQAGIEAPHLLKATTEQFKEETLTTLFVSVPDADSEKLLKLADQDHFLYQEVKFSE